MICSTDYVVATRVALVTNWEGTSKACNSNTTVTLEVARENSTIIGFVIAGGFEVQSKYMYQKRLALPDMTRPTIDQTITWFYAPFFTALSRKMPGWEICPSRGKGLIEDVASFAARLLAQLRSKCMNGCQVP